tara:strand:- start:5285 stop:6076 length:792 start_codon:yes stop_codon:yes gene_type:complete
MLKQVLSSIVVLLLAGAGCTTLKPALTFSDTQTWDKSLFEYSNSKSEYFSEEEMSQFYLPPFPPADSEIGRAELQKLKEDMKLRTPERLVKMRYGGKSSFGIIDLEELKEHDPILIYVVYLMKSSTLPIYRFKKKYDRVRPQFIDPEIIPAMELPAHPSYPSGSSAHNHMMAYGLALIAPEYEDVIIEKARQIARNREVAGIHYKSDTEAGKLLARQVLQALKPKKEFQEKLKLAKAEYRKRKKVFEAKWQLRQKSEITFLDE